MKKRGRPSENPKHGQYRLRLSSKDIERLDYLVVQTGKTVADILRSGIEIQYKIAKFRE